MLPDSLSPLMRETAYVMIPKEMKSRLVAAGFGGSRSLSPWSDILAPTVVGDASVK
jgi:hypothetical protein